MHALHTCTHAFDNWAATLAYVARQMMHRPVDSFPPDSRSIRCTTPRFALHRMLRAPSYNIVHVYARIQQVHPVALSRGCARKRTLLNRALVNSRKLTARISHLHTIEIRSAVVPLNLLFWVRAARAFSSLCTDTWIRMRFQDCFNVSRY